MDSKEQIQSLIKDAQRALDSGDGFQSAGVVLVTNDGNYFIISTPNMTADAFISAAESINEREE